MAVTPVGSLAFNVVSGVAASVDVPTGADTDLEVALGGSNFFEIGNPGPFGPPSGGGWTLRFTVDRGANDAHVRCWTRTAPAGAHTVTLNTIGGEEVWLGIRRLAGVDLGNPIEDVDGATSADGNHTAPALTLAAVAYLFGCAQTATFDGSGNYTPPTDFTELQDFDILGDAMSGAVAEDQAAGPGVVGPFTFTYSLGLAGCALVAAIRAASTGTDLVVQDAVQEQVAENVSLIVNLAVDDAVQLQFADTVALTVNLSIQDAVQQQVADTVALIVNLSIQDAVQLQFADSPTITPIGSLAVQDAAQEQVAESPTLGPGLVINALLNPSWYGYPDRTNTGTIAALTPVTGAIDVFTPGQIIENLDIDGVADGYGIFIGPLASGTIIRNVRITTTPGLGGNGIRDDCEDADNPTLIEDVEIRYAAEGSGGSSIIGNFWRAFRVLCDETSEGPRMGDGCLLQDSCVPTISVQSESLHADAVQSTGSIDSHVVHCTLDPVQLDAFGASAAVIWGSELSPNIGSSIRDCLLDRGGFTLRFGASAFPFQDYEVSGNRFGRNFDFGPYDTGVPGPGLVWTNNVFDDDNTTLDGPPVTLIVADAVQLQVADNVTLILPGVSIPELTGIVSTPGLTGTLTAPGLTGTVLAPQLTGTVNVE